MLQVQVHKDGLPGTDDSVKLRSCSNIYNANGMPDSGNSVSIVSSVGGYTGEKLCLYADVNCFVESVRLELLEPIDLTRLEFPIKSYRVIEAGESCLPDSTVFQMEELKPDNVQTELLTIRYNYINWLEEDPEERMVKEQALGWKATASKLVLFWYKAKSVEEEMEDLSASDGED